MRSSDVILHSSYNSLTLANDIALIRISGAPSNLASYQYVGLIDLPTNISTTTLTGYSGTASGWGRYSDLSNSQSQFLKYVALPIVANSVCESVYGSSVVRSSNICTSTTSSASTCGGDSGGPLTAVVDGKTYLVGIVSYGAEAGCTLGYPAGFTRVTSYLTWISQNSGCSGLIVNVLLVFFAQLLIK